MKMNNNIHRTVLLLLAMIAGVLFLSSCIENDDREARVEQCKKLAGELRDNKLYQAAVDEYENILSFNQIDFKTRANINYLIAKIYFENIRDYENASAFYIRARTLDPDGSFYNEASRNLVTSLEKMGNLLVAKRELDAITDIDTTAKNKNDVVVARIGGVPVWLSEIDDRIQTLPPEIQKNFMNRQEKKKFVQQYIGIELMYRAAVREDYGKDPEIIEQQQQFYKKLLVDKYIVNKVIPQVKIDTMDVRNYYEANKSNRYDNNPYDSVKAQVFIDYQGEKMGKAYSDYIAKLAKIEKVDFLEQNIR